MNKLNTFKLVLLLAALVVTAISVAPALAQAQDAEPPAQRILCIGSSGVCYTVSDPDTGEIIVTRYGTYAGTL